MIPAGTPVFIPEPGPRGKQRLFQGEVVDTNESLQAVKVRYVTSIKRNTWRSKWLPLASVSTQVTCPVSPASAVVSEV